MPQPFLSPPPGQTQLRAPRRDEGADILGNIAGNDPNILGQIAQQLLKLREPVGLATMGMGASSAALPPSARSVAQESLAFLPSLMPQARPTTPRGWTSGADLNAAVSPTAINQRAIPMLEAAPTGAQPMFHPRVPGAEEAQLAALRAKQQELLSALASAQQRQSYVPAPVMTTPGQHGGRHVGRGGSALREGTPLNPSAILSADEIKALMSVMKNTTPPMLETPPATPKPRGGPRYGGPRIGRRPEDRPEHDQPGGGRK